MRALRRGLSSTDVVVLMLVLGLGTLLFLPAYSQRGERVSGTKCANNLRQLAIAAICYSDDKRQFPHLGPGELSGGPESDVAYRTLEALEWYGYSDTRESWVCPSSLDVVQPRQPGKPPRAPGSVSPLFDPAPRPSLDQTDELSYGWTRRRLGTNARSTLPLAADRAVRWLPDDELGTTRLPPGRLGNHRDRLELVQVDGAVVRAQVGTPELGPHLVATDPAKPESGFLGIHDPSVPPP
jgi:hypothetical protein